MKENNLLAFYKDILKMLKVHISEDGGLYIPTSGNKGKLPFTSNKKHMYLPTKDAIKTSLEPDENNKLQVVKELFNPLDESVIHGDNKSLLRLKLHVERLVNNAFAVMGETLLKIVSDKDIQIDDLYLLEFISALNERKTPNRKNLTDDNTVKAFVTLYKNRLTTVNKLFVHTFIKRGGEVDNIKYNRTGVISFPILEEMISLKKNETIDNLKLRLSDKDAIEVLHVFTFNNDLETLLNGLQFPSKDKHSPAFVTLLMMYDKVAGDINRILDSLITLDIDATYLKENKLNKLPFKISDLENILKNVQPSLKEIPSNMSIHDTMETHNNNVTNTTVSYLTNSEVSNNVGTKLYNDNNTPEEVNALDILSNNTKELSATELLMQGNKQQNNVFNNQPQNSMFNNNVNQTSGQLFNNTNNSMFNNQPQNSMFNNNQNNPNVTVVNNGWL